jgi:hypothetical protein
MKLNTMKESVSKSYDYIKDMIPNGSKKTVVIKHIHTIDIFDTYAKFGKQLNNMSDKDWDRAMKVMDKVAKHSSRIIEKQLDSK